MQRIQTKRTILLCLLSTVVVSTAAQKRPSPLAPSKDDPKLPRVLLIGDSISIGYTLVVREQLKGIANVHRPAENCAGTTRGLERIDAWLGDGHWDVIHFNWGLHDLKYQDAKGNLSPIDKGQQQTPLDQYKENLQKLVARLQQTHAKLIFATTTPVPKGCAGRVVGDADKYNQVALSIMKRESIAVDDLNRLAHSMPDDCKRPANVHYTPRGYQRLGQRVARSIRSALGERVR